jgi:phosphate acyltransferase
MPSVIALDAMGSDRAPKPEIEGAILRRRVNTACGCCWSVRRPSSRQNWTATPAAARLPIEDRPRQRIITMEDKVEAIRAKRDSSMRVGLRMVREGQAAGFVTAGNTGAAMATAKVVLGAVPGVDRPALAAVFPTAPGNPAMLLDVGANVDCTPQNLEQFAVMGDIYFRAMFREGLESPAR